jgi:hypothetical protein
MKQVKKIIAPGANIIKRPKYFTMVNYCCKKPTFCRVQIPWQFTANVIKIPVVSSAEILQ